MHTVKSLLLLATLGSVWVTGAAAETVDRGEKHSIAVFVGQATNTNFVESLYAPWTNDMRSIGVAGAAYNQRFGTIGDFTGNALPGHVSDYFTVEGEVGGSFRFGDEQLGEGWVGLYLRYDGFAWNDYVYTSIAVNTGVSVLTDESAFERSRDGNFKNDVLLHYMGPEITLADPDNKNLELLLRYHHRSGVFGLFDGVVSGSTFISSGIRYRF